MLADANRSGANRDGFWPDRENNCLRCPDPRGVLADFGVTLPHETHIRVWDSTAEVRYLVIPRRPAGTDGLSEEQLAALVTRDSMIGTGFPLAPAAPTAATA